MGNTLEQHRAAIGGNAARQVSSRWSPSTGVFKPLPRTDQNRKKLQSRTKATQIHVTKVIPMGFMFSLLTMASPLVQRVVGYVICDHGSLPMAGSLDSKVMLLGPCSDSGMQELLEGCWVHQLTERGTSSYFSANLRSTIVGEKMVQIHVEDTEPDPGLTVSLEIQIF